jgi:N-ethylmaleimide reductase
MKEYETPTEATLEEIKQTVADFKQGAANALEAGFDGIELHGANGYLIDQFLRDKTNKRVSALVLAMHATYVFLCSKHRAIRYT